MSGTVFGAGDYFLARASVHSGVIVVEEDAAGGRGSYSGLHALVPILLGLAAPAVLISLVDPMLIGGNQEAVRFFLVVLLFITASVFAFSALDVGRIVMVTFDPAARVVEIVQSGRLAHREDRIPFVELSNARMEQHYDDDGYQWYEPVLYLRSGDRIGLPETTTMEDIEAINAALGSR